MISFQSGHYIGIKNNPIIDESSNSLTPQLTPTYHLLLEKKSISEISEIRGFTKDTIFKHTLKIVEINGIDCIIKYGSHDDDTVVNRSNDCITGLIGMKVGYIKQINTNTEIRFVDFKGMLVLCRLLIDFIFELILYYLNCDKTNLLLCVLQYVVLPHF
jgi:hypothetical protein